MKRLIAAVFGLFAMVMFAAPAQANSTAINGGVGSDSGSCPRHFLHSFTVMGPTGLPAGDYMAVTAGETGAVDGQPGQSYLVLCQMGASYPGSTPFMHLVHKFAIPFGDPADSVVTTYPLPAGVYVPVPSQAGGLVAVQRVLLPQPVAKSLWHWPDPASGYLGIKILLGSLFLGCWMFVMFRPESRRPPELPPVKLRPRMRADGVCWPLRLPRGLDTSPGFFQLAQPDSEAYLVL